MTCLQCTDGYSLNTLNLLNSTAAIMSYTCIVGYCATGYFSESLQCQVCQPGCIVCLLDNTCFLCQSGYTLDPNSHMCLNNNCLQTSQFYNATSNQCLSCAANCRTCYGLSTSCTSCLLSSPQTYLSNNSCLATCPAGFFTHQYSLTCRPCSPQCATCYGSAVSCMTCQANLYLLAFYNPMSPICVALCPLGFWTNFTTCQLCSPNCKSCNGPSQYQCLSCYPNFYLDDWQCVYFCSPMKYADNIGYCDWCDPSCMECYGPTKYDCVSCGSNLYFYGNRCY
jgi:proprotein convertase subtilisin/kexin type 5